jgi:hypothetical protein
MGAGIGSAGARLGTGNLVSDFNWKVMAFRCERRPEGSRLKLFSGPHRLDAGWSREPIRTNGQVLFQLPPVRLVWGWLLHRWADQPSQRNWLVTLEFVGGGAILDGRRVREVHPKRGKWTRAAARPRIGLSKTNSVRESAEGMRQ